MAECVLEVWFSNKLIMCAFFVFDIGILSFTVIKDEHKSTVGSAFEYIWFDKFIWSSGICCMKELPPIFGIKGVAQNYTKKSR